MKITHHIIVFIFCLVIGSCKKAKTPDNNNQAPPVVCDCQYQTLSYSKGATYLWAPNSFTPNGDGLNDVFSLMSNEMDTINFGLFIYNPSQALIYKSFDMNGQWTGFNAGKPYPSGNYPAIVKYNTKDGTPMEKRFCIYLLPYDSLSNCYKSENKAGIRFGDQFNPTTGGLFATNELLCN